MPGKRSASETVNDRLTVVAAGLSGVRGATGWRYVLRNGSTERWRVPRRGHLTALVRGDRQFILVVRLAGYREGMWDVWPDRLDLPRTGGVLAALSERDWPIEYALSRDAEVTRWTFYPASMTETQARERCRSFMTRAREGRSFRWVICTDDGARAGTCGAAPRGGSVDVFYALLSGHRGRGLATAAVGALAHTATRLSLTPQLAIEPENSASTRVALRAGFALRGERREPDGVLVRIWERFVAT